MLSTLSLLLDPGEGEWEGGGEGGNNGVGFIHGISILGQQIVCGSRQFKSFSLLI